MLRAQCLINYEVDEIHTALRGRCCHTGWLSGAGGGRRAF